MSWKSSGGGGGLSEPVTFSLKLSTTPGTFESGVADGASAVAYTLDTTNSLSTSGAKLFSLKTSTTEKAYFDKDGGLTVLGATATNNAVSVPSAARVYFGQANVYLSNNGGTLQCGTHFRSGGNIETGASSAYGTAAGNTVRMMGSPSSSTTAVAVKLQSANNLTHAGAKIVSIENNLFGSATEVAYFTKDGALGFPGVAASSSALLLPDTARLTWSNGAGAYLYGGSNYLQASHQFMAPQLTALSGGNWTLANTLVVSMIQTVPQGAQYLHQLQENGNDVQGHVFDSQYAQVRPTTTIARFKVLGTTKLTINIDGKLTFDATNASGTPGAVTINKPTGQVAVELGFSSVTVTNSLVSTSSIVLAVLQDNTDALQVRSVVPAAGSFTIHLTGSTTGDRKVGFVVFN